LEVGLAGLVEHGRVAPGPEPGVAPRVPVGAARGEHVAAGADGVGVAVGAVLVRAGGVAEAGVRRPAGHVVHVPRAAGGRVAAGDVGAAALALVAPGLPGVAGGVVGRRVGGEDVPLRVARVPVVVDEVLADQDPAADRVHVRGVPGGLALGAADDDHLVGAVHAVGGGHGDLGDLLRDGGGEVDPAVPGGDLQGLLLTDRGGGRRGALAREGRGDVVHGAVAHADGHHAVHARGEVAEALAQQHGVALADRVDGDLLQRVDGLGGQAEELLVVLQVRASGLLGVGPEAGGERLGRGDDGRGAEVVPADGGAGGGGSRPGRDRRRDGSLTVVDVRFAVLLGLEVVDDGLVAGGSDGLPAQGRGGGEGQGQRRGGGGDHCAA